MEAILISDVLNDDGNALGADVLVGALLRDDVFPTTICCDQTSLLRDLSALLIGETVRVLAAVVSELDPGVGGNGDLFGTDFSSLPRGSSGGWREL